MRMTLLNMVFGSVSSGLCRCLRYTLARRVCRATHSLGDWTESAEGNTACLGAGVRTSKRRVSGFREGEHASEGRGWIECGTLNADRQVKPEGSHPVQRFSPHGRECTEARSEEGSRPQDPQAGKHNVMQNRTA